MKKSTCAILMCISPAIYAENFYAGVEYSATRFESGDVSWMPKTIITSAGYIVNNWLSVEGRLGASIDGEDETDEAVGLDINYITGIYTKFSARNEISNVSPYLVAGYTHYEVDQTDEGDTFTDSFSDVSIGLGLDIRFAENYIFNLEYINYYDKDGEDLNALSVDLSYIF